MPVWKLQTAIGGDSALARDKCIITPHFNDSGVGTDPQGLCDDWAAAVHTWLGVTREINVKAYDAQGATPVYPQGETTINIGANPPANAPREVALCLSFFSARNVRRQRGRLYLPVPLFWGGQLGVRPSTPIMDMCALLVPALTGLGGADVDWCVYSKVDDEARPVTNWWIDNEWDTIRSRGLRGTSRAVGTTSEG